MRKPTEVKIANLLPSGEAAPRSVYCEASSRCSLSPAVRGLQPYSTLTSSHLVIMPSFNPPILPKIKFTSVSLFSWWIAAGEANAFGFFHHQQASVFEKKRQFFLASLVFEGQFPFGANRNRWPRLFSGQAHRRCAMPSLLPRCGRD